MPMYKDSDITASLIKDKFPHVAAEIAENMNGADAQTLSVDSLKLSHPAIVSALLDEGKALATEQSQISATEENKRVLAILELQCVGYESIIKTALADTSMTADKVKITLFDAMNKNQQTVFAQHKTEGETLGATLSQLGSGESSNESNESDEEKALKTMAEAGKNVRGE